MSEKFSEVFPTRSHREPNAERVWRMSQHHLNLWQACPHLFQEKVLERRDPPLEAEHREAQMAGNRFHLLMQQRELGLPIEPFAEEDDRLGQWLQSFLKNAPDLLESNPLDVPPERRQAEHERTLSFQGVLLVVRYDLLACRDRSAQILDWKTYPRPQDPTWLEHHWQTRLYPFVLAETSDYEPEEISMTYWFAESQGRDELPYLQCDYSRQKHQQIERALTQLLEQFQEHWHAYKNGTPFPSRWQLGQTCRRSHCPCPRDNTTPMEGWSVADIPEVSI
ncbi:PD-(D/E)XK nuclease family protein [Baaleninema simplex]|uniref:PD-(D/E)XK nuclease family protein n=1 Tax=Baaleninema simplex TaxID=2862350 RepID=UPI00034A7AA3|nr:PD-(D/E)XK nuclease family protein [Baaleninema simplex]